MDVAVKANGVSCLNTAAIDNERRLLELLLQHPHKNILVVYGIVTDAPDGAVRLVMAYCEGGSLDAFLASYRERGEVTPYCLWRRCLTVLTSAATLTPLHDHSCTRNMRVV